MSSMTHETAGPDSFAEIASSTARAFIQLKTAGACVLYVGGSTPAANSHVGVVLESGEVEEVSFDSLETGDAIYARSLGDDAVTLLVMVSDAAPS